MNVRKQRQKTKKKLCKQAESIERENAELVENVRETERTSWAKLVDECGTVERLQAKQAKQRLTHIPKNRPQKQKIRMLADNTPYESIRGGVLSLGKLGKNAGYRIGAYELGFRFVNGKWRRLVD